MKEMMNDEGTRGLISVKYFLLLLSISYLCVI